jgi:hypothetical protein
MEFAGSVFYTVAPKTFVTRTRTDGCCARRINNFQLHRRTQAHIHLTRARARAIRFPNRFINQTASLAPRATFARIISCLIASPGAGRAGPNSSRSLQRLAPSSRIVLRHAYRFRFVAALSCRFRRKTLFQRPAPPPAACR